MLMQCLLFARMCGVLFFYAFVVEYYDLYLTMNHYMILSTPPVTETAAPLPHSALPVTELADLLPRSTAPLPHVSDTLHSSQNETETFHSIPVKGSLCSLPPVTYPMARQNYPEYADALDELESQGIATWYSDRIINGDSAQTMKDLVEHCPDSTRLSVVIYGLPQKDCAAGFSNIGSLVQTSDDYIAFLQTLTDIIDNRNILYILEPDAVGLLATEDCATEHNYKENLEIAVEILSKSENAEIYVDVGYWTLLSPDSINKVAEIFADMHNVAGPVLKGITLNTSNYRSNLLMSELCSKFQDAISVYVPDAHSQFGCIIDTSRNYNQNSTSDEWCNNRLGAIGHPPTNDTGFDNIDRFVWIKPPGDSDGACNHKNATSDAMIGPGAGEFFPEHFELLWNNGYYVQADKKPMIHMNSIDTI